MRDDFDFYRMPICMKLFKCDIPLNAIDRKAANLLKGHLDVVFVALLFGKWVFLSINFYTSKLGVL